MDDFELLQAYASRRAEDAFTALTTRYIDLVYSAAARQTGDAQTAEDVTQAVFLTLARKVGSISRDTILSGWLLCTTRFAAANARRLEQRRQHYEQQAMQSYVGPSESEAAWRRIAPLLDEALDRLGEKDRAAVVLRFFEQKSLKQVAEKLGASEDGAQKRISRAIEKLRLFFARHGKGVSAAALTGTLAANSVQAAPATLAGSVCAIVGSQGVLTGSAVASLANATRGALARARLRILAVRAGSVAVLLGLAVIAIVLANQSSTDRSVSAAAAPAALPVTAQPTSRRGLPAAGPLAAEAPQPDAGQLLFRVLDAQSGAPVTHARLTLVSVAELSRRTTNTFTTDAQGAGTIFYSPIPVKYWSHRIEIFRDSYVPKYVSWSESQQDRIDEIPGEYTVKIDRAVTIGGTVMDEQEMPVPGVRVVFSVSGASVGASRARERLTLMGNYHTEVTDARGRWSCNHVPARFGMIDYKPVHPQFQEKIYASDSPDSANYVRVDRIAEADLLAGRAIMRLKAGLTIAGQVTEENGWPVTGAKVTQGFDFNRPELNTVTEADGSFRFGNGRPRELSLTVQAAGLAPVVTSLVMNASVENLQFRLPMGGTLLGRVVDEADQPVAGATIEAASPSSDSRTLFEWRAKADADGRFSWATAPDHQEYAIYASGYESQSRITLAGDGVEQVVKLQKKNVASVRILGEVVDAETKLPPASVRVQIWETAKEPGRGLSTFTTRPEDAGSDGQFRLKTSSGTISYVLEAQADGYWPERLTNQVAGSSEVHLKIELKKAPLCAGVVLTPTGEPAAGATLAVCGPLEWAQMSQAGKIHIGERSGVLGAITDTQGRFRLPPKYAAEVIVVAHAAGFAELPFAQVTSNTTIALQALGRIEGTVQLGTKPLVGETIPLNVMPWRINRSPRVSLNISATTDAEGRFVFESVPPGEWKVAREINARSEGKLGIHFPAFSHGVPVVVRPGETARVALGGSGRPVIGKAVPPNANGSIAWAENAVTLTLKVPAPDAPQPPSRTSFDSDEAFAAAQASFRDRSQTYWASDQGMAVQRLQRQYGALFEPGGSFRIDDVPSGDYTLEIKLVEPPNRLNNDFTKIAVIGSLEMDVSIPALTGEGGEAPVDLGVLQLTHQGSQPRQPP